MSSIAVDTRLSLTLPDIKAKIKRRFKKPRKPHKMALLMCVWCGAVAVWDVFQFMDTTRATFALGALSMTLQFGAWRPAVYGGPGKMDWTLLLAGAAVIPVMFVTPWL